MLDVWTGEVVGTMHIYEISMTELAEKMGVTRGYLSMLLNCRKKTFRAERRVRAALMELIEERKCSKMEESRTS